MNEQFKKYAKYRQEELKIEALRNVIRYVNVCASFIMLGVLII
jgi:hypothetical protein